jgi:hypothetical protein
MKKSKLLLSSFCLALALTLTVVPSTTAFADGGPQGGSNSTRPAPPPPPPPQSSAEITKFIRWLISLLS